MHLIDTFWHRMLRRPYRLAVDDEGTGRPVLLLHGLAASKEIWRPLRRRLIGWRILAPDLLGFGESPKPDWSLYSVDEHVQMVAALLKKKRLRRGLTIVGHSMGCLVAIRLAAQYPGLVERLILYEPPLFTDEPEYRRHVRYRRHYFAFFGYVVAHPRWAFTQSPLLRMAKKLAGLAVTAEGWVPFERSLKNTIMHQQALAELRTIAVPTDIIHGRLDFVVLRSDRQRMFAGNKQITLHTVTDMHGVSPRSARYITRLLQ